MTQAKILGIKIDLVNLSQAEQVISGWLSGSAKRQYVITTPNPEFIMAAQKDAQFKRILNQSDLAIPDSARLGWASLMQSHKNLAARIMLWPFFLMPKFVAPDFPVTSGVDLMEKLCQKAAENGWKVGLIGGAEGVAERTKKVLTKKYPALDVVYAESGGSVTINGKMGGSVEVSSGRARSEEQVTSEDGPEETAETGPILSTLRTDLLFVAFGQVKQEQWIENYKDQVKARVFMGVGGSFDYLSQSVSRAPKQWQNMGLEWLFRLIKQPWRVRRFGALVGFTIKVILEGT